MDILFNKHNIFIYNNTHNAMKFASSSSTTKTLIITLFLFFIRNSSSCEDYRKRARLEEYDDRSNISMVIKSSKYVLRSFDQCHFT